MFFHTASVRVNVLLSCRRSGSMCVKSVGLPFTDRPFWPGTRCVILAQSLMPARSVMLVSTLASICAPTKTVTVDCAVFHVTPAAKLTIPSMTVIPIIQRFIVRLMQPLRPEQMWGQSMSLSSGGHTSNWVIQSLYKYFPPFEVIDVRATQHLWTLIIKMRESLLVIWQLGIISPNDIGHQLLGKADRLPVLVLKLSVPRIQNLYVICIGFKDTH